MLSCNLIIFFIQQFNQSNYSNWTAVHTSASSDRFRSCFFGDFPYPWRQLIFYTIIWIMWNWGEHAAVMAGGILAFVVGPIFFRGGGDISAYLAFYFAAVPPISLPPSLSANSRKLPCTHQHIHHIQSLLRIHSRQRLKLNPWVIEFKKADDGPLDL